MIRCFCNGYYIKCVDLCKMGQLVCIQVQGIARIVNLQSGISVTDE